MGSKKSEQPVLGQASAATPAWLGAVLRRRGLLERGEVSAVETSADASVHAEIVWLRARYSADSAGERPERFALKLCANAARLFGITTS